MIVTARDWLWLALIASLQYLPARQGALLLLRVVLGFPAAEVEHARHLRHSCQAPAATSPRPVAHGLGLGVLTVTPTGIACITRPPAQGTSGPALSQDWRRA